MHSGWNPFCCLGLSFNHLIRMQFLFCFCCVGPHNIFCYSRRIGLQLNTCFVFNGLYNQASDIWYKIILCLTARYFYFFRLSEILHVRIKQTSACYKFYVGEYGERPTVFGAVFCCCFVAMLCIEFFVGFFPLFFATRKIIAVHIWNNLALYDLIY